MGARKRSRGSSPSTYPDLRLPTPDQTDAGPIQNRTRQAAGRRTLHTTGLPDRSRSSSHLQEPKPLDAPMFKVPQLPYRKKSQVHQAESMARPASLVLLGSLAHTEQTTKAKCADWVQNKAPTYEQATGFATMPFEKYANVKRQGIRFDSQDDDNDTQSMNSERTVRPLRQAGPETSYFESDADDPTVVGDRDISDEELDDVVITTAAKDWIFGPQGKGRYFLASDIKHMAALLTIEKHWGKSFAQSLPDFLVPLRSSPTAPGGRMSACDAMEWDKDIVRTMKQIAKRCTLDEFVRTLTYGVKNRAPSSTSRPWLTCGDVRSFYESLKKRGSRSSLT